MWACSNRVVNEANGFAIRENMEDVGSVREKMLKILHCEVIFQISQTWKNRKNALCFM
jgi:hypothetical protein